MQCFFSFHKTLSEREYFDGRGCTFADAWERYLQLVVAVCLDGIHLQQRHQQR